MAILGHLVRFLAGRAAADPRVREGAVRVAAKTVHEARKIAADPSPGRRLGRLAGRAKRRVTEVIDGRS